MNFKHKYLFLLPGLLVLIGILIFPVGFTVRLSMSSWDSFFPGLDYVGLENYFRIFQEDSRFWEAFGRLSFLSVTTVTFQYIFGFRISPYGMERHRIQTVFSGAFSNTDDDHSRDYDSYLENFFPRVIRSR